MSQVRESRYVRAATAALSAARAAQRRTETFYKARNGVNVKLTREEELAALARVK
jgi:hypothetical protein